MLKVITAGNVAQCDVGRTEVNALELAALPPQAIPPRLQGSQFIVGRVHVFGTE